MTVTQTLCRIVPLEISNRVSDARKAVYSLFTSLFDLPGESFYEYS